MQEKTDNAFYEISLNNNICHQETTTSGHPTTENEIQIKVYKRRFWMLFLFSSTSLASGLFYPLYAGISDVTMCYYDVSQDAANWTGLVCMVTYIILVFPVSWLIDRIGIQKTVLISSAFNLLASATQFLTLNPQNFIYVMVSQFFASMSNVFILAIPPCLAAEWFPSNEVSRACAYGVFGNQMGLALGFICAPLMISSDCSNLKLITKGRTNVAILLTVVNTILTALIIFTFQGKPPHPPSVAQAEKKDDKLDYLKLSLSMLKNVNFVLIFIMYGLMVGTYFVTATLLNAFLIPFFPGTEVLIGWMGWLLIVAGLIGSIVAGYVLDYTHKFKNTSLAICILSFFTFILFICFVHFQHIWLQFITIGVLGFFLTSFLPVGFEYGIEVTYPESEITSAGLLNASSMIFGIILTEIATSILNKQGFYAANTVMLIALLASCIICGFITTDYKRSKKSMRKSKVGNT
ncbi:feline leukemia virus subgroup C receptor-related protein 2-like isoform X1 [Uloborus diversus]|uniref:feline leukemia virus subgroup C receptor-related protein 2-like isoform X1 n=1 Tax=Uloborus diversus TaxID=327109 RepID=UPI00240A22B7|nr:feline leukemia virus subgroup C receptor-related protein 2-like isoform X1 [Uloborus diversus]